MDKVRRKIVLYSLASIFVLLTVMLTVINGLNFTMAADDADKITQILAERHGTFEGEDNKNKPPEHSDQDNKTETNDEAARGSAAAPKGMGPMGPQSPEMNKSVRYFTYRFDEKGRAKNIAYNLSAVDQYDGAVWARKLLEENSVNSTGWTNGTYRYRIYKIKDKTYVTVIDQGRELSPSYRILIISVCGELIGLLVSFFILELISKKLVRPLEDADRKQRQFIANVENEFKLPLTIINADTEIIEKESGCTDYTSSINRQVRKMTSLVKDLRALSVIDYDQKNAEEIDLSEIAAAVIDGSKTKFDEKKIDLCMDIEDNITVHGDEDRIRRVLRELVNNSLMFAKTKAKFTLLRDNERIKLIQTNDTDLPSGSLDIVFDRFVTLDNADTLDTAGLGLSFVKDAVRSMDGRVKAEVTNGEFILTIAL